METWHGIPKRDGRPLSGVSIFFDRELHSDPPSFLNINDINDISLLFYSVSGNANCMGISVYVHARIYVQPTAAHQTIYFGLCTALISRTLELISNCKYIAWRAVGINHNLNQWCLVYFLQSVSLASYNKRITTPTHSIFSLYEQWLGIHHTQPF
jgi:hypothetical protein